jgi:hypothetical protein
VHTTPKHLSSSSCDASSVAVSVLLTAWTGGNRRFSSQDAAELILEDSNVAQKNEQPSLLPQCLNYNLKLWHRLRASASFNFHRARHMMRRMT